MNIFPASHASVRSPAVRWNGTQFAPVLLILKPSQKPERYLFSQTSPHLQYRGINGVIVSKRADIRSGHLQMHRSAERRIPLSILSQQNMRDSDGYQALQWLELSFNLCAQVGSRVNLKSA